MLPITNIEPEQPVSYCQQAMNDPISLYERLMAVKPAGLSNNRWLTNAGLERTALADIKRGKTPSWIRLKALLDAIGVTEAEFEAGVRQMDTSPPSAGVRAPRLAFQGDDRPRDVPVLGTAECGDVSIRDDGHVVEVESMTIDQDDVIDRVRRPVSLDNRRDVYAIYFRGHSMSPRYEDGELGYVDPRQPAARLDYVIMQLVGPDGADGERVMRVLAKRLLRTTATYYEVEQFNPPMVFRVPKKMVRHVHRVMELAELVAF